MRSIPACAGETGSRWLYDIPRRVYPRVCGGNPPPPRPAQPLSGLSPRVRGKHYPVLHLQHRIGSIPACAGETALPVLPNPRRRSIPACAGETGSREAVHREAAVYPRVCGGNGWYCRSRSKRKGLSPRVRGKPGRTGAYRGDEGSIPACAGETICPTPGGNRGRGLSPRVRGKPLTSADGRSDLGSIPACAGETATPPVDQPARRVYPRVCGGNHLEGNAMSSSGGLSPRVRGKRGGRRLAGRGAGSIPACAGETGCGSLPVPFAAVYPRVCGGNRRVNPHPLRPGGLSPRVRGKPASARRHLPSAGSIPACAGETG